jgi:hypothetical protein
MCADDSVTRGLIEEELKKEAKHGGDRKSEKVKSASIKIDNINLDTPDGTSRDQALRALRKHNPAIYKQVIKGELSAHAGMVKAGLRPHDAHFQRIETHRISTNQLGEA